MSSVRLIASKSKKGKTHKSLPSWYCKSPQLPLPTTFQSHHSTEAWTQMILLWRTYLQQDPMPWANLVWPERTGRRHRASHSPTGSATMNYPKIIPLVFWDTHFPPNTCRWREFSPLQPEGRRSWGVWPGQRSAPSSASLPCICSKICVSTCNVTRGAHVNAKT